MAPLTNKGLESETIQENCHICKKIKEEEANDKKSRKVRDHCHYTEKHRCTLDSIYNLKVYLKKLLQFSTVDHYESHESQL